MASGLLGKSTLSHRTVAQVAALLHDHADRSCCLTWLGVQALFSEHCRPSPWRHVDVLAGGRAALEAANTGSGAWRWPTTRSTTWSPPSRACSATPPTWN